MKKVLSLLLSTAIMLTAVLGFNITASAYGIDFDSAEEYEIGTQETCYFDSSYYGVYSIHIDDSCYLDESYAYEGDTKVYIYDMNDTTHCLVAEKIGDQSSKTFYFLPGDYYIVFEDVSKCSESLDFELTATQLADSFQETTDSNQNNTKETANNIDLGTRYDSTLAINDYTDWYKFTVTESGTYEFYVEAKTADTIRYSIYDSYDSNKGTYSTDSASDEHVNLDAGTYYLKVFTTVYGGAYSFSVSKFVPEVPSYTPSEEDPDDLPDGGITNPDTGQIQLPTMPSVPNPTPAPAPAPTPDPTPAPTQPSTGGITNPNVGQIHNHSYNLTEKVSATTSRKGYDVYTCSCGDSYITNYTPALKYGKVKIKSLKALKKHKIKITYVKKKGADGYQVCWAKNKKFKNNKKYTTKKSTSSAVTINNCKKGKKYYFKVRAFKYVDGVKIYGKWSSVKSVKCK